MAYLTGTKKIEALLETHRAAIAMLTRPPKEIQVLLAEHQAKVAALETTLSLLGAEATEKKVNGHATVLAQALSLDGQRRQQHGPKVSPESKRQQARQKGREFLALFDRTRVTTPEDLRRQGASGQGITPFLTNGYLKRKGGGFVRTVKPYYPETPTAREPDQKKKDPRHPSTGAESRSKGATFLAIFRETPVTAADAYKIFGGKMPLAAFVTNGYLKKKGDGYVRTSKPYGTQKADRDRRYREKRRKQQVPYKTKSFDAARFLGVFNQETPLPITAAHAVGFTNLRGRMGAYIAGGYLKPVDGGYLRTAKPYGEAPAE